MFHRDVAISGLRAALKGCPKRLNLKAALKACPPLAGGAVGDAAILPPSVIAGLMTKNVASFITSDVNKNTN